MRTRRSTVLSASILTGAMAATLGAAAGISTTASANAKTTPECDTSNLSIGATMESPDENIMAVTVTNDGADACTIDRIPTVTFGDLDGSARAVPATESAPRVVKSGDSVHAALRTAPGMDDDGAQLVQDVTVAASPGHDGLTFSADELGSGEPGVYVYDPVTTWWHPTFSDAEKELQKHLP